MVEIICEKNLVHSLEKLRIWERKNLPLCRTISGYDLFMTLVSSPVHKEIKLKNIYNSLPYSEKTLRTLLKDLESDGWITMPKKYKDKRVRVINLTEKFHDKISSWKMMIEQII